MQGGVFNKDLLYPELSYQIIGTLFEVYNEFGGSYKEKHYQRAIEIEFRQRGIGFISQCPYKIRFKDEIVGRYYMDFVVENLVVVEIKRGDYFSKQNIQQLLDYLKATEFKLGF